MIRKCLTNACNRLAGAAFFEPGLAAESGPVSTLRHGGNNRSDMHSRKCAIIQANIGVT